MTRVGAGRRPGWTLKPGRVRAYLGKPMCCTTASDCEDDNACTVESCSDGGCALTLAAGCCYTDSDCDDGVECTKDVCQGQKCTSSPASAGTPCGPAGYCDGAASPTCAECTEDDHCSDGDGCTTDTCESGSCEHAPVSCDDGNGCTLDSCEGGACNHTTCAEVTLGWNELDGIPDVATADLPFVFSILGWGQNVSFHRTGNASLVRTYTPPAAIDGAFLSDTLAGVSLTWDGEFPYIDVLSDGLPVTGSVTFDFGGAATTVSPSHRFILVIGGTGGGPGEGPTTISCDVPLTPLGYFDAFFAGVYATFTAPSTLVSSTSITDGLSYFALPSGATSVTCTIEDNGLIPDAHGYAVGLIDTDVTICSGDGPDAQCVDNACGDGIIRDGEACDDGDLDDLDGCSSTCTIEPDAVCTGDIQSMCVASN